MTVEMVCETPKNSRWGWSLGVIYTVLAILCLRQLGDNSLGYPDAAAQLMDGVFVLDFLSDLPLARIYDYTVSYYAQYPALSIGYRPPFFPFVEAILFAGLGPQIWAARLAIFSFAIAGFTAWFFLLRKIYNGQVAFWACGLLATTPFVVQWGWYTMAEIPVLSMAMLTAYVFYRYAETDRAFFLYAATFLFCLTIWTKQTAVFLALWFVSYIVFTGKLFDYLRRRELWISVVMAVVILTPLAVITIWLGKQNISQSIGSEVNGGLALMMTAESLKAYFVFLYEKQVTAPLLVSSLVGMVLAGAYRDRRSLYCFLLIVCTYVFFTYIVNKDDRYSIFWIPAFCFFAVLPLAYFNKKLRYGYSVVLVVICGYQVTQVYARAPDYADGYDQAARFILKNSRVPLVFFDGYNHGYFTYFMRTLDPGRGMYVLRGDKLLSSSAIRSDRQMAVHAHSKQDILSIFDRFGIEHIVVENEDRSGIPIHQELRRFLSSGPFTIDTVIPIMSNRAKLKGQRLIIYRYLKPKKITAEVLELNLPTVGKTILVPVRPVDDPGSN